MFYYKYSCQFPLNSVLMAIHTARDRGMYREWELDKMRPNVLYRNVRTGLREGKEPGPTVSYFASPVICSCPGNVPVQHE